MKKDEKKFRTINPQNKAIKSKLLSLIPNDTMELLLEMLGFLRKPGDENFVFVGDYFTVLRRGVLDIENMLEERRRVGKMSQE